MKNKTYRPIMLFVVLGILIFMGIFFSFFIMDASYQRSLLRVLSLCLLLLSLPILNFHFIVTDKEIVINHALGWQMYDKKSIVSLFKKVVIPIEELCAVRILYNKNTIVEFYTNSGKYIRFPIGAYNYKEIINLCKDVQMEINTAQTGDDSVSLKAERVDRT